MISQMRKNVLLSWGYKSTALLFTIATVAQLGCGSSKSSSTTTGGSTATSSISGVVSSLSNLVSVGSSTTSSRIMVTGEDFSNPRAREEGHELESRATSDSCASGTYSSAYVGGGGTVVASGTYTANAFTVPAIPQGQELVVTFTCSDGTKKRCLSKSGDSGISCNPVADAVLTAFETAIGKGITDTTYAGKRISQISRAIIQAAQNSSTATDAFNTQISACQAGAAASIATCEQSAITASAFAGAFKLMQAAINGWTVDALFTLMVDVYGATVGVDSMIYSQFATGMDAALGTDFIASTRAYIAAVVADQLAGGNTYVTKLNCSMGYNKYQSGGNFNYSPVMQTVSGITSPTCDSPAAFAKNGFTAAQITKIEAGMNSSNGGGGMSIDLSDNSSGCTGSNWNNTHMYCVYPPQMSIVSKYVEANRNDPTNQYGGNFFSTPQISMIATFPELDTAFTNAQNTAPAGCLSGGNNGPPNVASDAGCQNFFKKFMATNKNYFGGLMGLYIYLKNPASTGLLSLTQLHQIFTQANYLNAKIATTGFNSCGASIAGNGGYLPSLLSYANGIFTENSKLGCSYNQTQLSASDAAAILATATVPYVADFKQFETIPSSSALNQYVFGSGYHTDYNPTGPKFFYASSVKNSGIPIFCKMTNKDTGAAQEAALDNHTVITCLKPGDSAYPTTAPDANGVITIPTGYPYTLQSYGFQGDSKGGVFALANAKSGASIYLNNSPVLIYQISAGNGAGNCDGSSGATDGSVTTVNLNFGFGNGTQSAASSVYCMDMTNFAQTSTFSSYWGGNLTVQQTNASGASWPAQYPQVGALNSGVSGQTSPQPLCYFAPSKNLTISSLTGLVSSGTTGAAATVSSSTGEITNVGTAVVDFCSNSSSYSGSTQYYLVMQGSSWQDTTRTNLKAHLIGTTTGSQILNFQNWATGITNFEALQVFIGINKLEAAIANQTGSAGAYSIRIAPNSAISPIMQVQVANQKWNAKFDPYCDDQDGNGKCTCTDSVTGAAKDPTTCTLQDNISEPTMSQSPINPGAQNFAAVKTFFKNCGGKTGAALGTCIDGGTTTLSQNYMNTNQLYMDPTQTFKCAFLVSGETSPRSPTQVYWNDYSNLHQGGCPAAAGGAVVALGYDNNNVPNAGGGPIRLVNPVPMNNAYQIVRPNTTIKLMNYATKTVGQGTTINPATPLFAFDEALALISLRYLLPLNIQVYTSGTTTATAANLDPSAMPIFQQVWVNNSNHQYDMVSAVLRAMTNPAELTAQ